MTRDEQKAAVELIQAIRETRHGLEMAAATNLKLWLTNNDLTFAMEQALLAAERLTGAIKRCRAANADAHRLVPIVKPNAPHEPCAECGGKMHRLTAGPRDTWECLSCNHQSK